VPESSDTYMEDELAEDRSLQIQGTIYDYKSKLNQQDNQE